MEEIKSKLLYALFLIPGFFAVAIFQQLSYTKKFSDLEITTYGLAISLLLSILSISVIHAFALLARRNWKLDDPTIFLAALTISTLFALPMGAVISHAYERTWLMRAHRALLGYRPGEFQVYQKSTLVLAVEEASRAQSGSDFFPDMRRRDTGGATNEPEPVAFRVRHKELDIAGYLFRYDIVDGEPAWFWLAPACRQENDGWTKLDGQGVIVRLHDATAIEFLDGKVSQCIRDQLQTLPKAERKKAP